VKNKKQLPGFNQNLHLKLLINGWTPLKVPDSLAVALLLSLSSAFCEHRVCFVEHRLQKLFYHLALSKTDMSLFMKKTKPMGQARGV